MSTTITLQNSINFVKPILKNQPLDVGQLEPALTAGNIVLQRILGPPFRWPFNRVNTSFTLMSGQSDYPTYLPDFRFLDIQWLSDPDTGKNTQMTGENALAVSKDQSRPTQVAPQFDDNAGNITFRFSNTPDKAYTAEFDYQKKATLITSYAGVWGTVPDEFEYVFNTGFLYMLSLLINDSRFPIFEKWFTGALLGAQDGLSAQDINIFLGGWMADLGTVTRAQGKVQQGLAGRSV